MAEGEFRGWATIKGCLSKKSQRFYLVLQESCLYVFKDDSMKAGVGKLSLGPTSEVRPVVQEKKDKGAFALRVVGTDKKKDLLLIVSTGEDYDHWLSALSFAINLSTPEVIGIPLAVDFARSPNPRCPFLVQRCIAHIEENDGISQSGLFRVSAALPEVNKLRDAFNGGGNVEAVLADLGDINVVSNLLKLYLRELPDSLLTYDRYKLFLEANQDVKKLSELVHALPKPNKYTLQFLMKHLVNVTSKKDVNMMTPENLSIVFGPTIMRPCEDELHNTAADSDRVNRVCATLISSYVDIFDDIEKEAATAKPRVKPQPLMVSEVDGEPIDTDEQDRREREEEKKEKKEREEREKREKKEKEEREKKEKEELKMLSKRKVSVPPPMEEKPEKPDFTKPRAMSRDQSFELAAKVASRAQRVSVNGIEPVNPPPPASPDSPGTTPAPALPPPIVTSGVASVTPSRPTPPPPSPGHTGPVPAPRRPPPALPRRGGSFSEHLASASPRNVVSSTTPEPPEIQIDGIPAPAPTGPSFEARITALESRLAAMEANFQKQTEGLRAQIADLKSHMVHTSQ